MPENRTSASLRAICGWSETGKDQASKMAVSDTNSRNGPRIRNRLLLLVDRESGLVDGPYGSTIFQYFRVGIGDTGNRYTRRLGESSARTI